ncbi:MAG: hypothetical protein GX568_03720, partial [Candidatus Gastranaerophilales bacterium]|nr:hypothetical protein [Candidatus Gastranaerophilales bacterium]
MHNKKAELLKKASAQADATSVDKGGIFDGGSIDEQYSKKLAEYKDAYAQQTGFLGKATDLARNGLNAIGIGKGGTVKTKKEQAELEAAYAQLEAARKSGKGIEQAEELVKKELADSEKQIERRKDGNEAWVEGIATMASITAGFVVTALTKGKVSAGMATASTVKTFLKGGDELTSKDGEGYTLKEGIRDAATGAVDFGFAHVGNKVGGLVRGKMGKAAGLAAGRLAEGVFDAGSGAGVETVTQIVEGKGLDVGRIGGAAVGAGIAGTVLGGVFDIGGVGVKKAFGKAAKSFTDSGESAGVKVSSKIKLTEQKNVDYRNPFTFGFANAPKLDNEAQEFVNKLTSMKNADGNALFSDFDLKSFSFLLDSKTKIDIIEKFIKDGYNKPYNIKEVLKTLDSSDNIDLTKVNKILEHKNLLDEEVVDILREVKNNPNKDFNNILESYLKPATQLSEKVKIKHDNYTIVSQPKKLQTEVPDDYEIVVICDRFEARDVDVPGIRNHSHGETVQEVLSRNLKERIALLNYSLKNGSYNYSDIFEDIIKRKTTAKNGQYIKKLNLSVGKGYDGTAGVENYESLSKIMGFEINSENLIHNKDKIIKSLKNHKDEYSRMLYEEIMLINKMIDLGIDVYAAAGNAGINNINMFALSKAKIVGATNVERKIADYSSESPLVNYHALGEHVIYSNQTTPIDGTSYACPQFINEKIHTTKALPGGGEVAGIKTDANTFAKGHKPENQIGTLNKNELKAFLKEAETVYNNEIVPRLGLKNKSDLIIKPKSPYKTLDGGNNFLYNEIFVSYEILTNPDYVRIYKIKDGKRVPLFNKKTMQPLVLKSMETFNKLKPDLVKGKTNIDYAALPLTKEERKKLFFQNLYHETRHSWQS